MPREVNMSAIAPVLEVTWEKLPDDFVLDDTPVDNIAQPMLAAALTESLLVAGRLPATALTTTNYGICATVNGRLVVKAPDWSYVPAIRVPREAVLRSYTPHLQGENLLLVMEFLSDTDGSEYADEATWPYGKWFFYEQILEVPHYVLFDPRVGTLECYRLDEETGCYASRQPDARGRYWVNELGLCLGVWRGIRDHHEGYWLRWWDEHGHLLPWRSEQLELERERVEQERQRAERAEQARRAAIPRLLAAGLTVEQVAAALGLTVEEVHSGCIPKKRSRGAWDN
jgi:hypothetical protein